MTRRRHMAYTRRICKPREEPIGRIRNSRGFRHFVPAPQNSTFAKRVWFGWSDHLKGRGGRRSSRRDQKPGENGACRLPWWLGRKGRKARRRKQLCRVRGRGQQFAPQTEHPAKTPMLLEAERGRKQNRHRTVIHDHCKKMELKHSRKLARKQRFAAEGVARAHCSKRQCSKRSGYWTKFLLRKPLL